MIGGTLDGLRKPRPWWRSTEFLLFVAALLVYNVNARPVSSADTFPTRYLPISILTEFDLDLDEFPFLIKSEYPFPGAAPSDLPYYIQRRRGHIMSTYPVMPAILATPVYALPVLFGLTGDPVQPAPAGTFTRTEIVGSLLGKLAASLVTALSVILVYRTLRRLTSAEGAKWITIAYAFATSSWSVSAQGLWQSTMSQALLAGTSLAFLKAREGNPSRWVAVAGSLLGVAVMSRPTAIVFAIVLALYALREHAHHFLRSFVPPAALLAVLLLSYNLYYFGTLNGGYEGYSEHIFTLRQIASGFYGLLLSPNRGLLVFSPVVVAGLAGLALALRNRTAPLLEYTAVATLLTILLYSTAVLWHGSFSYSYRFLVDLLPGLAIGATVVWHWIQARRWRRFMMGSLFVVSVALQIVGAFFFPCGWYRSTINDPAAMARFYSWRDLEVAQCLKQGLVQPDAFRLIRRRLAD